MSTLVSLRPKLGKIDGLPLTERIIRSSMPVTESGCWIWLLAGTYLGYGQINVGGKMRAAHRMSWSAFNGREIPEGMDVLHSCDIPCCVNPDHLRLGTESENMREMVRRNRAGAWCHTASLTQSKHHNFVGLTPTERIEALSMPVTECGCWIFMGGTRNGYGRLSNYRTGKNESVHRIAYEAYKGYIPPDMKVLHRCDIPACVNPDHLFLGTQVDNMRDREKKKRAKHRIFKTKLPAHQLDEIRASFALNSTLAVLYGVSAKYIAAVRRGSR